jgi:GT2 family glycosyltransferase
VAHDGARWLPEVLAALTALTVRPRTVVAVDTGSTDGSADLLRAALGQECVHVLPRETGYGAAVEQGLALAGGDPTAWVWLLHDDAAPAPDCLAALLAHAQASPSAAVLGPKALDWHDPRVLVEVGITTDRAGNRTTGLERREQDQGQHDAPRDVLAVGTAGALVRRETWDAVGGLPPELPLFRDELDLGWRVNGTGARVVVVPAATVRHARAATTGRRSAGAVAGRATRVDRQHALFVLLAHASTARLALTLPVLVLASLLRAVGFALTRQLASARDELEALVRLLADPGRLSAARRRRRALRTAPAGTVRPLLASRAARVRGRVESFGDWLAGGAPPSPSPFVDAADAPDTEQRPGGAGLTATVLRRPGVLLALTLALVALVAERSVLSVLGGVLSGGRLLPPPDGASDLWAAYASTWSSAGVGTPAPPAPRVAVLGALSTVLLGKPWLAVDVLLLGCVPLGGLTAYLAVRRLVVSPALRLWAAATWALLPVATGAVAAGRLDAAVVQVTLPLLAVAAWRVLGEDPRGAWHRAWALGLLLAVVVALAPTLWLVAAPLVVARAVQAVAAAAPAQRPAARRRAGAGLLALAVPAVLLLPWSLEAVRTPSLLVHGPGRLVLDPALADPALPAWQLPLLVPGGAGLPPAWVTGGLLVAALAGLVRAARRSAAIAGWTCALAGLALALVLARTEAQVPASGADVPVWPGVPLQVAAAGLLVAALVAGDGVRTRLARSSFGWRQVTAMLVGLAAVLTPVLGAAHWVFRGADDPLERAAPTVLPAFVPAELAAEPGLRVLALDPHADGTVGYELATGAYAPLGTADLAPRAGQLAQLDEAVADLLSPRGSDAAAALATRAVRYVSLPRDATSVAAVLDAQPGLVRRSDEPVLLWEVVVRSARLQVLAPDLAQSATSGARAPDSQALLEDPPRRLPSREVGATTALPPGRPGRLLVLAEAHDQGWRAELDGEPLEPAVAWGWAQAFHLPAGSGELLLRRAQDDRRGVLAAQAAGLVLVGVLSAPGGRRRRGLEPADDGPGR